MGRQGKGSARPTIMDVDKKAAEEAPSDFEGDSGVSLSEDVQGVEAVSPPRPARQQKHKVSCPVTRNFAICNLLVQISTASG